LLGVAVRELARTVLPARPRDRPLLESYAQTFNTVEVNNSFYRLPEKKTFADWARRTPEPCPVSIARQHDEGCAAAEIHDQAAAAAAGLPSCHRVPSSVVVLTGRVCVARLDRWADVVVDQARNGRDVFAYFNNDPDAQATRDAMTLRTLVQKRLART